MPRQRTIHRKLRVNIYIDEDTFWFFKYFFLSPTEGRIKHGFSALIDNLLAEERKRIIALNPEAASHVRTRPDTQPNPLGTLRPDERPHGAIDPEDAEPTNLDDAA